MISISFYRDTHKHIKQVLRTGHAGYADPGCDIDCEAVSSQVISVENSLVQLLNIEVETEVNEIEGDYLKVTLPSNLSISETHDEKLLLPHLHIAFELLS